MKISPVARGDAVAAAAGRADRIAVASITTGPTRTMSLEGARKVKVGGGRGEAMMVQYDGFQPVPSIGGVSDSRLGDYPDISGIGQMPAAVNSLQPRWLERFRHWVA